MTHPAIIRARRRWRRACRAKAKAARRAMREAVLRKMAETPVPTADEAARLPLRAHRDHAAGDNFGLSGLRWVTPLRPDGTWNPDWWTAPLEMAVLMGSRAMYRLDPEQRAFASRGTGA